MKITIPLFAVWTFGLLGTHLAYSQENSPALLAALRDAKTATVKTEELLLDENGSVLSIDTSSLVQMVKPVGYAASSPAAAFDSSWAMVLHPTITEATAGFFRHQAKAH